MKVKFVCVVCFAVILFAGCKSTRIGPYEKAAQEFSSSLGDFANYKERGDALKKEVLATLVPLSGRIKFNETILNATGMATTASGAAGTALSQVLTTDAAKKMIGAVSAMATTVFGGVQTVFAKTDRAVEYSKVCKAAIQDWDMAPQQDRNAYVTFITRIEAIHDHYPMWATYKTDIEATTTAKKVKNKEIIEHH